MRNKAVPAKEVSRIKRELRSAQKADVVNVLNKRDLRSVDYHALGSRIKAVRKELDLTQKELAAYLNVSTSFMGHIERGTRIPSLQTIYHIIQMLDVSFEALLTGYDMPTQLQTGTAVSKDTLMMNDLFRVIYEHKDEWIIKE